MFGFMNSAGRGASDDFQLRRSAIIGLASATAVGKKKNNGVADPTPSISMSAENSVHVG